METRVRAWRVLASVVVLTGTAFLVASCGGGADSTSTGTGGSAVGVSLASASPQSPGNGIAASSVASADASMRPSPNVEAVWITIERMALIPRVGDCRFDPAGEESYEYDSTEGYRGRPNGHVVETLDNPVTVNLLGLSPGGPVTLPNPFDSVPPGVYGKIRLYFSALKAVVGGETLNVKPKGGFHLDIVIKDGGLVVPDGAGAVQNIVVCIVPGKRGIKVVVIRDPRTGDVRKLRIRPVVFATLVRGAQGVPSNLSGTVESVDAARGAFTLRASADGSIVPVEYDTTTRWSFRDGETVVAVPPELGIPALRAGASADVLGLLSGAPGGQGSVLNADEVILSFPVADEGTVMSVSPDSGDIGSFRFWPWDGVLTVTVLTNRQTTYYDNSVPVDPPLDSAIVNGRNAKVRGYEDPVTHAVEAFWITIGTLEEPIPM